MRTGTSICLMLVLSACSSPPAADLPTRRLTSEEVNRAAVDLLGTVTLQNTPSSWRMMCVLISRWAGRRPDGLGSQAERLQAQQQLADAAGVAVV